MANVLSGNMRDDSNMKMNLFVIFSLLNVKLYMQIPYVHVNVILSCELVLSKLKSVIVCSR